MPDITSKQENYEPECEINEAYDRTEPLFRRFEALRMNLAKHEVPKTKGVPSLAPGYGEKRLAKRLRKEEERRRH